ncbi:hypothetical protein HNP55_001986 [Paucibacter oligotrophus]|uniref:Uncharacterized protein n=1 Tax=Roseateles oligotrophus TaxID=1769250 RepID=A0A840LDR6_9BURK|nr:hypothetical protein [Roseateles oligotrophus]MBB4843467.1 hypothetical protein [Roseateles oligotrophus]
MDTHASLMESLASSQQEPPAEMNIYELRRPSVDELQRRLRKWLRLGGEVCEKSFDRGEWTHYEDRTLVRLPQGAQALMYHASGAFKLSSGRAPMEALFKEMEPAAKLTESAEAMLKSLGVQEQLGRGESLSFERLWQTKAGAQDREGKAVEPVLCRAIAAFRHHVDGIPVLGPASLALQMAGGGAFDSLSVLMRGPAPEALESAKVIHPERAARALVQHLAGQLGQMDSASGMVASTRKPASELKIECPAGMQFGYLSLPKRKVQRLLAPVYIAMFQLDHGLEKQAMVLAVSATEKSYLALHAPGSESLVSASSKTAARKCC